MVVEDAPAQPKADRPSIDKPSTDKPLAEALAELEPTVKDWWEELRAYTLNLGGDVTEKPLEHYVAFRRFRNFASVIFGKRGLTVYLKLDRTTVPPQTGFVRDVRTIGHWGTGDLEVWISDKASLDRALPLVSRAYQGT